MQAIKLVLGVFILYIITWGPFIFYMLLFRWGFVGHNIEMIHALSALTYCNSCVNPFLYTFASK